MRQIAGGHRHPVSKASALQIRWNHLESRIEKTPTNKAQTPRPKPDKTKPKDGNQTRKNRRCKKERETILREKEMMMMMTRRWSSP
jgi:hypothetical protein